LVGSKLAFGRPKFIRLLSPNGGEIVLDHLFPISDILSHSGDTGDQTTTLCEITPNFACFWLPHLWGWPQIFEHLIIKCTQMLITWQSFKVIG